MTEPIAKLAASLSEAQRRVLLSIDVEAGMNNERMRWPTLRVLREKGLTNGSKFGVNGYRELLTPLGIAVRNLIQESEHG